MAKKTTVFEFIQNAKSLEYGTDQRDLLLDNSNKELLINSVLEAFSSRFQFLVRQSSKENQNLWLFLHGKSLGKTCTVEVYCSGKILAKNLPNWDGKIAIKA